MKKALDQRCVLLLPVLTMVLLMIGAVFALLPQYQQTFLGALSHKVDMLAQPETKPRIIVIGGSSVAFGQQSDLLAEQLPGYTVVNFGLYAGLGTDVMLELALPSIRPGDVVIISPEQNEQTLSGYFGAEAMWQAADGHPALLLHMSRTHASQLMAAMPIFAAHKAKQWLSGQTAQGDGVYRSDHFNPWGDVLTMDRDVNTMPGSFDPNMMICFDAAMVQPDFVQHMNQFAQACQGKGATVFYRFCPMNAAAITLEETAKQAEYEEQLRSMLSFPLLGTLQESVLDSEWFFDTNFHLNAAGTLVNTAIMAAQLQKALGLPQSVSIVLPEKPQVGAVQPVNHGTPDDSPWFLWEQRADGAFITGLTAEGAQQTELTIPSQLNGQPVTAFSAAVFAGNKLIQRIMLPESIRRIDDGSFAQCTALESVVLMQPNPSQTTVGNGLLKGTSCLVMVPREAYSQYQTNYFWSVHAARIRPLPSEIAPSQQAQTATPVQGPVMYVHANGGIAMDGSEQIPFAVSKTHLRTNTPMGQRLFTRAGYAPLCWNTQADGSGVNIAFGSRVDSAEGQVLYMKWISETPMEQFTWQQDGDFVTITGWHGDDACLVIPQEIGGHPVTAIADRALENADIDTVVLPPTLLNIGKRAFAGSSVQTIWLYDHLTMIAKDCFDGCTDLTTMHLSADTSPRYAVSYFAAFADKMDWLRSCEYKRKIILAGGSASRYAYDSRRIKQTFPEYEPVNMGVYAYTNMLPQYQLMQQFVQPGDVLLSAPEFDTTETQFCVSNALDDRFWAMMEADYGNTALLDLRQFSNVAGSLRTYLRNRADMLPGAWEDTPKRFDDDGNAIMYDTYNQYGDYTLVREGAASDELLQHVRPDYTVEAFPLSMIESLSGVYQAFEARGVRVFFTYAPRNHSALTENSTPTNRQQLHAWLTQNLHVPMLLDIEDSLYPGQYFYLIDNHLSDGGVYLHTKKIIQALQDAGI